MAAVLGTLSFGFRSATRDRLTVASGTPVYDTSNLPPGSASSTSMGGNGVQWRRPWYDDPNASTYEPSTDEFWFHAHYYTGLNNSNNDLLRIGVCGGLTEFITVSAEDLTNLLTIRVAGVVRATAALAAFSVSNWERIHVHVTGNQTGDEVRVYVDGSLSTPVVSYTLIGADQTALAAINGGKPNGFYANMKSGDTNSRLDDMVAWDPADPDFQGIVFMQSCSLAENLFTADGLEQDWSGDYTAIDELPPSDADKITASAVGQESTFTTAAIGEPNVYAVVVKARVTRTGTDAGSNLGIVERDGGFEESVQVAAPGDGDVEHIFQVAPDGLGWSPVKRDAARFGFIAAT